MTIGVLALQGAVALHKSKLQALGLEVREVTQPKHLDGLSGIILPGGESSALLHLLHLNELWKPLYRFTSERPSWGVCAGAILLAKSVHSPDQESLGVIDLTVVRNAYGRQKESFVGTVRSSKALNLKVELEGVFIRAPKISACGPETKALFFHENDPVCVEQRHVLVTTFHPELTDGTFLHEYFLNKCEGNG